MLIVTAGTSGQEAVQLLQAGVAGILHKHHSIKDLCDVVRRIVSGGVYLEPVYHDAVYRSFDRQIRGAARGQLNGTKLYCVWWLRA